MTYKDPEYHKHYREKNKEIIAERQKNYKKKYPGRHTELTRTNRNRIKQKAIEYLGNICKDCGGTFHPAVFDFHHLNPEEKDFSISAKLGRRWETTKLELDKCILLCANCHRIRHWKNEE